MFLEGSKVIGNAVIHPALMQGSSAYFDSSRSDCILNDFFPDIYMHDKLWISNYRFWKTLEYRPKNVAEKSHNHRKPWNSIKVR